MQGTSSAAIHIVEDEPEVRDSLIFQLEARGHSAIGYESGEAFLDAINGSNNGCAIIDVHLPGMNGLAVLHKLVEAGSSLPVVVVTGRGEVSMAVDAMRAGAVDFIEKPFAKGIIANAVQRALGAAGRVLLMRRQAIATSQRVAWLTAREREVFEGFVDGKLGKQVAIDLGISPRTVEVHRARIMTKLGATTHAELLRLGLLWSIHHK